MENRIKKITSELGQNGLKYNVSHEKLQNVENDCVRIDVPIADRLRGRIYLLDNKTEYTSFEIIYDIPKDRELAFHYDEELEKRLEDMEIEFSTVFGAMYGMVSFSMPDATLDSFIRAVWQFKSPDVMNVVRSVDDHLVYFYEKRSLELYSMIFEDADEESIMDDIGRLKEAFVDVYGPDNRVLEVLDKFGNRMVRGLKSNEAKQEMKTIIDSFNDEVNKLKEEVK